jgi:outer membrane protein assembly factor BamA
MLKLLVILLLGPLPCLCQDSCLKETFLLPVPVVCSNPTAGFIYGVGLSYTFHPRTSRYISALSSNATYSTNKLLNLNVKSSLFTASAQWFINTDWRLLDNTETTYGLGSNSSKAEATDLAWEGLPTSSNSLGQVLQYRQIRLHQVVSRLIAPHLFAGLGFRFDRYEKIADGKTSAGDSLGSYQYIYSIEHGFSPSNYTVSGVCINLLYDSRDNQIDAYSGYYFNLNYQVNALMFGSTRNSRYLLIDYRSYYSLDADHRNVIAFWVYGNFLTGGHLPYLALPALGYDQRQRTGRGYAFGRFRGEDLIYQESEYRFPISGPKGRLGGVLFLNLTSTSNKDRQIKLAEYFQAAYGGGLRLVIDRKMRTRLQGDLGIGNRSVGFYFGIQETF